MPLCEHMRNLSLAELRNHPKYPFLDIRDLEQFLLAQLYWLFTIHEALGENSDEWTYWLPPSVQDQGTPILSIRRKDRSKGLIVDQQCIARDLEDSGVTRRPLVVFVDHWEDEDDLHQMPYLRMYSAISEETRGHTLRLMRAWMDSDTNVADMQLLVDHYYDEESPP